VFADAHVGVAKPVTVSVTLGGGAAALNYTVTTPVMVTTDITAAPLVATNVVAANKVYDGTMATTATCQLPAGTDAGVTGGATAVFADAHVGVAKPVTVSVTLGGGAAALNYTVTTPVMVTADITAAPLVATNVVAANKVYDGTMATTASCQLPAGTDAGVTCVATAVFADAHV